MSAPTTPTEGGRLPPLGFALLAGITLLWGLSWPLMRIGLDALPPFTFRSLMTPAAGVLLLVIAALRGERIAVPRESWGVLVLAALLNIAAWHAFSAFGVAHMESGRASVIAFTMPLWAALLAWAVLREQLTGRHLLALALGMAGIAALLGGDIDGLLADPLGPLYMTGAAVCWAAGTLVQKRTTWNTSLLVITGWQLTIASIPLVGAALALETVEADVLTWRMFLVIAFFVFGALGFCFVAWYKVLSLVPQSVATLSTLLVPVIGVVSGTIVHGEPLGVSEISALALVCSAIGLVLTSSAQRAPAPS